MADTPLFCDLPMYKLSSVIVFKMHMKLSLNSQDITLLGPNMLDEGVLNICMLSSRVAFCQPRCI